MRGYTVHLLFHLLAIVCGAACGVSAGLWWFSEVLMGLWLAVGALCVGIIVLVLEGLYISGSQPPPRRQPRPRTPSPQRGRTRPDLEPVAAPSPDTLLQPTIDAEKADEETKTSAADALNDQWSTRQS